MRSSTLTLASLTITVVLFAGGCGDGDDPTVSSTPAPPAVTTPAPTPTDLPAAPATKGPASSGSKDGSKADPKRPSNDRQQGKTIAELVGDTPELATYRNALSATNGLSRFKGKGPFTVFAPNNDAFTQLGSQLDTLLQPGAESQLANILNYHVVSGRIKGSDLTNGKLLTTLQGNRLRVQLKDGQLGLKKPDGGRASIVTADLKASNGVIHIIDSVMIPRKG